MQVLYKQCYKDNDKENTQSEFRHNNQPLSCPFPSFSQSQLHLQSLPPLLSCILLSPTFSLQLLFPILKVPFKFFGFYSHYHQNIHTHWYLETKYLCEAEHELSVPLNFDYLTYYYFSSISHFPTDFVILFFFMDV